MYETEVEVISQVLAYLVLLAQYVLGRYANDLQDSNCSRQYLFPLVPSQLHIQILLCELPAIFLPKIPY